jgi:hypothetical protein
MPCQLQPVVQLLCEEMELSFLEAGRPCPPWREWAATINRWMSDQYVDIIVPEPTATDEEVHEFITRCCQFSGAAAGSGSAAGNSGASASTTSTCSPVNLNQQRLQDKMHVSSVLSSASTSSRRCVAEPLHKQLGFSAVAEDEAAAQLLPTTLRDASFTSVTSAASAESVQMLSDAAKVAAASGKSLGMAARSLSIPSAEILSSSADSVSILDAECYDVPAAASSPADQQQAPASAAGSRASDDASSSSSSAKPSSSIGAEGKAAGQPPAGRSKSLLTAHMQLKAQLQQQQRSMLFPAGSADCLGQQHVQAVPHLQHQLTTANLLQQAQQQAAPQQQLLLQQLQLQHQQMLAQHMAMQQLQQQQQQQQGVQQQQLAVLQQQCSQPAQQRMQSMQPQQLVAPLLPVVHTVRPCGVPVVTPVALNQPVLQHQLQQSQQQQQSQQPPRQPPVQLQQQLQAMQAAAPAQQAQPRLLRLIQRK